MALRVEQRDGSPERRVLIGMIVSKTVLAPIADRWKYGLFASKYANLIASWCVRHYRDYRDAPGSAISDYYAEWATTGNKEKELVTAIESLLSGLSHEAAHLKRDVSPEYLLDVAGDLFEKVRLKDLSERVLAALDRGDTAEATTLVERSRKVEIGVGSGVDVLTDRTAMERAFARRHERLFDVPGALGSFYGEAVERGKFISFLAKEKGKKSFFVRDLCWRAVQAGRNVAYFELGDDVQDDVLVRFSERATGRSSKPDRYKRPLRIESREDGDPELETDFAADDPPLTASETMALFDRMDADGRFKLSCHPAGTLSVSRAESILDRWMRDGWVPDVIAFDYADIAAPIDQKMDKLEQINATWTAMRAISQRLKALVVTATQCNREGFSARTLTREHVGGDHRKLAHVTDMIGINQTSKEEDRGVIRLNRIVGRQWARSDKKYLYCASNLAVSNPCVISTF